MDSHKDDRNFHGIQLQLLRLSRSAVLSLEERKLLLRWKCDLGLSDFKLAKRLVLHRRDKAREYRKRRKLGGYNVYDL